MSDLDDATMPDSAQGAPSSGRATSAELDERYEVGAVLGRGGMGEIRLARDLRINREVAVKLLLSPQRDELTLGRFFREARVQGVLEHPAVVPVHDLGIDPAGNPYFVMKRLAGITLADVLVATAPELRARWPRRQLLARLVDVCLAIEFAHTRGVTHRDVKPANLMLGDFGEAYVLDWGLARIADEREDLRLVQPLSGDDLERDLAHTAAGDLLGTPGYMSPEQARGEAVGPPTDVFALGCVLFEILAGSPALPRGLEGLAATVSTAEHRPSSKAADIPPELDDLCARATAAAPDARPSARALADGLQAYLDGDRDTARRRELASEHARDARTALARDGDEARATAMRAAGRALALDPSNQNAQDVLGHLMIHAPASMPAEALAAADAERARIRQDVLRAAAHGYVVVTVIALALLAWPYHRLWPIVAGSAAAGVSAVIAYLLSHKPLPNGSPIYLVFLLLTVTMLACGGMMFGPLLLMPIFIVGTIAGFLSQPSGFRAWVIVSAPLLAFAVVLGLEFNGVLPRTFRFEEGALVLTTPIIDLTPFTLFAFLVIALGVQIANTLFVTLSGRRAAEAAQNRVHAQTWHMQHLLPRADETNPVPRVDPP